MQVASATSPDRFYSNVTESDPAIGAVTKKTTLDQDDFMRLLAVQFQQQDPLKPMDDTAFIAQMAQFTALDQSKALLMQMKQLGASQEITTANSYLGRQVTLDGGDDKLVTGIVTGVEVTDGAPRLIVGEHTYSLSSVLLVEPAPVPPTSSDSNPTNP